jgi:hypothetical protein
VGRVTENSCATVHDQHASLADLIEAPQRVVIEKVEQISVSKSMIARSQRLNEALDLMKTGTFR